MKLVSGTKKQNLVVNNCDSLAMYGYSFCKGGKQAFKLLVANVLRVTAINSVGDFVLFLGKVLVVAATVLIGAKMLQVRLQLVPK